MSVPGLRREDFPVLDRLTYLNTASAGLVPASVVTPRTSSSSSWRRPEPPTWTKTPRSAAQPGRAGCGFCLGSGGVGLGLSSAPGEAERMEAAVPGRGVCQF